MKLTPKLPTHKAPSPSVNASQRGADANEDASRALMEPGTEIVPANSPTISTPKYDSDHPAAHLREHQFKPGESGNPSGRPKGIFGATALKRLPRAGKDGESKLVALIDAQIDKAIRKRDTRAAEFLRDSVDGKPATGEAPAISAENLQINFGTCEMPSWWPERQAQTAVVDEVTAKQPKSDSGS